MLEEMLLREAKKMQETKPKNNGIIAFTKVPESDKLLCDLKNYPHAFLLSCIGDKQMDSTAAWLIPFKLKELIGDFTIETLYKMSLEQFQTLFNNEKLHRYNNQIPREYYSAIHKIVDEYNGDASNIWKGNPSSATVIRRLLEFDGVGVKIATMTTNILSRDFGVSFSDRYAIDISVDTHIRRVFKRMNLINSNIKNKEKELIIYKAREISPEYPGILDAFIWNFGREVCVDKGKPKCDQCIFKDQCPKNIESK